MGRLSLEAWLVDRSGWTREIPVILWYGYSSYDGSPSSAASSPRPALSVSAPVSFADAIRNQ